MDFKYQEMLGGLIGVGVDLAEIVAVEASLGMLERSAQGHNVGALHLIGREFRAECEAYFVQNVILLKGGAPAV